jgi:protein-arginine kinase activator protein McsA
VDLSGYMDGLELLQELTECPNCGIMYEEKRLGIGECANCFITRAVRDIHGQMQYHRWGTLPIKREKYE